LAKKGDPSVRWDDGVDKGYVTNLVMPAKAGIALLMIYRIEKAERSQPALG